MKKLAQALRKARESKDLTQMEAAEKAKLSVNYYRLIESGNPAYVSEKVALKLIKAIGAPKLILGLLEAQKKEAYGDARKRAEKARPAPRKRLAAGRKRPAIKKPQGQKEPSGRKVVEKAMQSLAKIAA